MKKGVTFKDSQGSELLGSLSIPSGAKKIVIISHGFSSSKDSKLYPELEEELYSLGIGSFRYDAYGHGELYCEDYPYSVTRDITLSKWIDSLQSAIQYIRDLDNYEITLFGSSFGGLVSLVVASRDSRINALALKSPVTEPISMWKERLGSERMEEWEKSGTLHYDELGEKFELDYGFFNDLQQYDVRTLAKGVICPTLIVHGSSDTVVPIEHTHLFLRSFEASLHVIEGAEHSYSETVQYDEMKRVIVEFVVGTQ